MPEGFDFLPPDVRADHAKALRAHLVDCMALRRKFAGGTRRLHNCYVRRVIRQVKALEASL